MQQNISALNGIYAIVFYAERNMNISRFNQVFLFRPFIIITRYQGKWF